MKQKTIRVGGASGYWGDAALATPQLLAHGQLDYIVYDYLAEVTMSILARARANDANFGYAVDFVTTAMGRNLKTIAAQNIKVISNAGGVNPKACADALRTLISNAGLDLKVAVISGDDLSAQAEKFHAENMTEMFSGAAFPHPKTMASLNAYLGAVPIAKALNAGADIVITGRCVDSAVTLGACLSAFDWQVDDFDKLAQASLAGHIIECGPQATGGNFTDWELVKDSLVNIGYPIVEVSADSDFTVCKPENTGGMVSVGTVAEQMVYEIGDPQSYILPDVICDFSNVKIRETFKDHVHVSGAKGRAPTEAYKVCATYVDGHRAGMLMGFTGFDAVEKAQTYARSALARAGHLLSILKLDPYRDTSVEVLGAGSQTGIPVHAREVVLKVAAHHADKKGAGILIKEMTGMALATPAGLSVFNAARPKPSPVVRLFSFLVPKSDVDIRIDNESFRDTAFEISQQPAPPVPPIHPITEEPLVEVELIKLAWGRSGDKGDKANIGIIARKAEYLPWIWASLDADAVQAAFAHFAPSSTERFYMPGVAGVNYLLHDVLGGGGMASLRNDPQGKAYAQILLAHPIKVPANLLERIS